ncbi:MAG: nuclear transport factor 2 family protein [Bacteroidetes bacterium]|nr:nuclear transport factor 2 family protein [Bacteroidota bacterium]
MDSKEQIIINEKKFIDAVKNNNVEVLDALLHDELQFIIPSGQVISKEQDLANYRSGNIFISDISSNELVVNLIGDTAISTMATTLKGKYFDQPIDGRFRYIRVWKLFNDQWKVIAGSGMQI